MIVMARLVINGEYFEGNGDNMAVALRYEEEPYARAIAMWEDNFEIWYFTIMSNEQGDTISFSAYDSEAGMIWDFDETVEFQDGLTIGSPDDPFILEVNTTFPQEFSLIQNWNWISFNIHPYDTSVQNVFYTLYNNIYQVKNQTQSATNYGGVWFGDLSNITDGQGYLVKMNCPDDFTPYGISIDYQTPIYLQEAWNWIAYYPQVETDLDTALISIAQNAIQVKSQTESAICYNGIWLGDLNEMTPGMGYKLNMASADTLIYQIEGDKDIEREVICKDRIWNLMAGTQYNMIVIAESPYILRTTTYALCIGVFDDEGNCRSIGVKQNLEGNDFWYFTIVGNEEVAEKKELYFKIYDKDAGKTYRSEETILFANNTTLGSPDKPIKITFAPEFTDEQVVPTVFGLYQNYPNPFNPKTKIEYQLPKDTQVEISIYNIRGEKVRTLVNEKKKAGYHNVIWNGIDDRNRELSSGVYLYRIKTDGYSAIKKMLLIK